MFRTARSPRVDVLVLAACLSVAAAVARAQQTPIAVMFADDQKRDQNLAPSFLVVDLPVSKTGGAPPKVYFSAGDLVRSFDRPEFRPDGAIVPTNAELQVDAPSPATQQVLFDRVRKLPDVARDLHDQVEAYKRNTRRHRGSRA